MTVATEKQHCSHANTILMAGLAINAIVGASSAAYREAATDEGLFPEYRQAILALAECRDILAQTLGV